MNTKYCGICEQNKPRSEFDTDLRRKDGKYPTCRSCRQEWHDRLAAMVKRSKVA